MLVANYSLSGIPFGGVGTGSFELRADGKAYEWWIFNNGPWTSTQENRKLEFLDDKALFFALRVKHGNRVLVRLLRRGTYELGANPYTMPWLKQVEQIVMEGEPPLARFEYLDEQLPVNVTLTAFSPFIPLDIKNSSLPAAVFVFRLENKSDEEVEVSLLMGLANPFTYVNRGYIGRSEKFEAENLVGIELSGREVPSSSPAFGGGMSLAVIGNCEKFCMAGLPLDPMHRAFNNMWIRFRREGSVADRENYESRERFYALVGGKVKLKPKESREIVFLLTWFFPNHVDETGERLGHYYENFFDSSAAVARYVTKNMEYLRSKTLEFHRRLYEDKTVEGWVCDVVGSQLSTLIKCTWLTKDGDFGLWEGLGDEYFSGPSRAAFNTTDVMFYASIALLALFPELEKKWMEMNAAQQLSPEKGLYYIVYALAVPENLAEFKKRVLHDPSIVTDFERLMETVRDVIVKTGKDPSGRVMHFFTVSLKKPDAYHMVDLMPKFVLLAYRDAVWTGDRAFLEKLWSNMKKAVEVVLRIHDEAGLKLPYHYTPAGFEPMFMSGGVLREIPDLLKPFLAQLIGYTGTPIGFQSFDVWSMLGVAAYTSVLWVSALHASSLAAKLLGDDEYAKHVKELLETARENLYRTLWNGEYFDLWFDPVSGDRDRACMAAQLAGQWALTLSGAGYAIDREKVSKALSAVYRYNFKDDEGLINGAYPGGPRPSFAGDMRYLNRTGLPLAVGMQMDTPWTGVEYAVASHMIYEGMVKEGLNVLKSIHERYASSGMYWNHIEWGTHYMRPLSSWSVVLALGGIVYNGFTGSLTFKPRLEGDFRWILTLPCCWGSAEQRINGNLQEVGFEIVYGCLKLKRLIVNSFGEPKEVSCTVDGRKASLSFEVADDNLEITFSEAIEVREGEKLKLKINY